MIGLLLGLAACGGPASSETTPPPPPVTTPAPAASTFALTSPAFSDGQPIPTAHTCQGADVAPPLSWTGAPTGTQVFALIVDDPDAPDPAAPKMTWVHWVLYDLPATAAALPEGGELPAGTRSGTSDFKKSTWGGPCPPIGRHRYFFKLYALDAPLPDLNGPTKAQVEQAMNGHVLGQATLVGTYQK